MQNWGDGLATWRVKCRNFLNKWWKFLNVRPHCLNSSSDNLSACSVSAVMSAPEFWRGYNSSGPGGRIAMSLICRTGRPGTRAQSTSTGPVMDSNLGNTSAGGGLDEGFNVPWDTTHSSWTSLDRARREYTEPISINWLSTQCTSTWMRKARSMFAADMCDKHQCCTDNRVKCLNERPHDKSCER